MSNEVIMGFVLTICSGVVMLFLQERATHIRQERVANSAKERAVALIEGDLSTLKSTTTFNAMMLQKIDDRLDSFAERITRVETKLL